MLKNTLNCALKYVFLLLSYPFFSFLDAGLYAHHVFKAFDANRNGAISFRVSSGYQNSPNRSKSDWRAVDSPKKRTNE
jgi:hypothetical protein